MVGDEVRLDKADRTAVEQDEVVVGRVASLDRRQVVLDDVLVGRMVGPPAPHVLTLQPFVQQPEVAGLERPEREAARQLFASFQSSPTPTSTASGGSSATAPPLSFPARACTGPTPPSRTTGRT